MRKILFFMTAHAIERMYERNMKHPHELGLKIANRKAKKLIIESCPIEGYKKEHIYWTQRIHNEIWVYVTVQKDVAQYTVLTCFKYDDKANQKKPWEGLVKPKNKMQELTFGQKAVGLTFNPSNNDAVAKCKQTFADAIDQLNDLRNETQDPEVKRMCSLAITDAQTSQMWAVKALTWK